MDASVITARCFHSGGASYGIERCVQPRRWKSADHYIIYIYQYYIIYIYNTVFFNNYVATRLAKDTTDKMLGITSEALTARNSLSTIQIREPVMKSSVNKSEDIDEEDISENEVEFIDLEKNINPSFCSEDKSDEFESDELESDQDNMKNDKTQEYSDNSSELEENSDDDGDISYHP